MTCSQVDELIEFESSIEPHLSYELVETHISWVIIGKEYVFKIKKPIKYSFLDFSSIELRKFYCQREVILNKRYSENLYLDVVPIYKRGDHITFGITTGIVIDYAVKMRKLDPSKQLDVLISYNKVGEADMRLLAKKIITFHKQAEIITSVDPLAIGSQFNDLKTICVILQNFHLEELVTAVNGAIKDSKAFLKTNSDLLYKRKLDGFYRDCHGDLHTRNIFLLPFPQPFDCIEFNDEYRYIDVLNEVAFLCMDLDALGRKDLSDYFIEAYNSYWPIMQTTDQCKLFIYYKAYRANVRAKVNALRVRDAKNQEQRDKALNEVRRYLKLMFNYLKTII